MIFRFRSELNPPITLTTLESAHDESETPQIDRMLMTVRNPLFGERTCRAPTNDENVCPSSRSRSQGRRSARTNRWRKRTPLYDGAPFDERVLQRPHRAVERGEPQRPEGEAAEGEPRDDGEGLEDAVPFGWGRRERGVSHVDGVSGRRSGKRMTSRIDCAFVSAITSRSIPMPNPAVGGIPCSSARM